MTLYHISLNNLRRRKTRVLFLVLGLTFGVAAVVGLVAITRAMEHGMEMALDQFGANIVIIPRSDDLSLSYGGMTIGSTAMEPRELAASDLSRIRTIKNVESIGIVAPKLFGLVEIGDDRAILAGVDPKAEVRLKKWWRIHGRPLGGDQDQDILAGSEAARRLHLTGGSPIEIKGQSFTVCGVLEETGSQDDRLLFAPLATVQSLLGKPDRLSMAEVAALCSSCPIEEIVRQASGVLPGMKVTAVKQVVASRMEVINGFRVFAYAISVILAAIGALVVFVSMMGSVSERTREIGIFRAIGFRQRHVLTVILTDASLVSLAAGILGSIAGYAAALFAAPAFPGMGHSGVSFSPSLTVAAVLASASVGTLAGLYPAVHAARIEPTAALRAL